MAEQLLIRFRGICGHLDLSNGTSGGPKKKRTVLVRHSGGSIEHHVPYVEFFVHDVETFDPTLNVRTYSRPGVEGRLARVDLDDGTEIRLKGIPSGEVEETIGYQRDVPRMGEVVKQSAPAKRLLTKNAKDVDLKYVTAVFDMPKGRLVSGEPEAFPTRFSPEVKFKERRLARWSDLYLTYEPPLILELVTLGGGGSIREIVFRDSLRMLAIGNEPERLILGSLSAPATHAHGHDATHVPSVGAATPVQPTGHYILYYSLLENEPAEKPVPVPVQFDSSGCPNNNYP